MNQDRLEAICNLITDTCLGVSKEFAGEIRGDIPKNVLKLAKLADSIGRRYREFGEGAFYQDKTKYLGHKARELGRQIGLKVDPGVYPMRCTIGDREVFLP